MTASRDADQLINAFLAEGLVELPDRAYDAVREHIEHTRQRVVIGPWRVPVMPTFARLAIAAAAVVIVGVVGISVVNGPGVGSTSPPSPSATLTPNSSPSAEPSLPAYRWPAPLAAGTYTTSLVWDPAFQFTFTVPDGWDARDINVLKGNRMSVQFLVIDNIVTDTCSEELRDPPIGSSPEELASAMSELVTVEAAAVPAMFSDGRDATYLEYSVGPDLGCDWTQFRLLRLRDFICEPARGCGGIGEPWSGAEFGNVLEHNRSWIMNVGRSLVLVGAEWTDEATPADLDELQAVIDSVSLATPLATPAPQPAPAESP